MFEKWCQDAYCDGVREMYDSKSKPLRFLFWIITMIVMISGTGYFIFQVIQTYRESPTVTVYSIVPNTSLEMPQIMLCFNGGLNASALVRAKFSENLILVLSGALTLGTMDLSEVNTSAAELKRYLNENKMDINQFYQNFGYRCEDLVEIVYQAGSDRIFENIACRNVTKVLSQFHGICLLYTNNGVQHWPGATGGVKMYLKTPNDSLVHLFPEVALKADRSLSFVVTVEKQFYMPTEKSYLIPVNTKSEMILDGKHYQRLPESRSSCTLESNLSMNLCLNRCFAILFYEHCGCIPLRYYVLSEDKNRTACSPFDERFCDSYQNGQSNICGTICKPKCSEWIFDVQLSYAPSGNKQGTSTALWIGFNTMQYTKIKEDYSFTIETAVANIGYQAGLWLGVSTVTVIQGFYYLFVAIWNKFISVNNNL